MDTPELRTIKHLNLLNNKTPNKSITGTYKEMRSCFFFKKQTACDKAICEGTDTDKDGLVNCVYKKKNGDTIDITCKYKG